MLFTDDIFCKIADRDISGLFCIVNGRAGDCNNCQWDGEGILSLPISLVFNNLNSIRELNRLKIRRMNDLKKLGLTSLQSNLSWSVFKRILEQLKNKGITIK